MFLGIDIHIDKISAVIIEMASQRCIYEDHISFDEAFPHFQTQYGLLPLREKNGYSTSPTMWIEAIELLFERLSHSEIDQQQIKSIGGSALPSFVLVNQNLDTAVKNLHPCLKATDYVEKMLAYDHAPTIFHRASKPTRAKLTDEIGEDLISKKSGIRLNSTHGLCWFKHLHDQEPETWQKVQQIHTATSFIRSILIGRLSRVNISDTSHFALYNHKTQSWDNELCSVLPKNIKQLLPDVNSSYDNAPLSPYFIEKYGFSDTIKCSSWVSRESAYFIANACKSENEALITLNHSYTYHQKVTAYPKSHHINQHVIPHPFGGFIMRYELENGLRSITAAASATGLSAENLHRQLEIPPFAKLSPSLPFIFAEPRQNIKAINEPISSIRSIALGQAINLKLFTQDLPQPSLIRVAGKGIAYRGLLDLFLNTFQTRVNGLKTAPNHALAAAMCAATSNHSSWAELFDAFLLKNLSASLDPETYLSSYVFGQIREYHQLLLEHTA